MSTRRERAKEPLRQQNKQLTETQDAERLRQEIGRKNHTAEIYIDIAKLIFGGVIIGGLFEAKEYWIYFLIVGTVLFFVLLWIGNYYYNRGNKYIGL